MRSWDVGVVVCCVCLESYTATHRNRVIYLVFDTRSQTTGQLTGSRIVLLCCRRHRHIKQQSGTHIYHRATSHTCSRDSFDRDKTRSHSYHCLICMIWTISGSHQHLSTCLSGYRWMLLSWTPGFLNKQNVQLVSDVFAVVQVMHHLYKKNM